MLNAENIALIQNIKNKSIYFIVFTIITIYILIQFISVSNFSYNYLKFQNYGDYLKKRCENDNIEYETNRYQLYNNILNYLLNNDIDNKSNYLIILIIYLVFAIIFTIIFTYILYIIINEIKNINLSNSNEFKFLCNILILFTCITSISYIPTYIGIKMDKNIKLNENDFEGMMQKILYGLVGLCCIIIIIRLNVYNHFKEYTYSTTFIITLIGLYMGIVFYTKKIINYYKNNIIKINYKYNNIKNIEDRKKVILKRYNNDAEIFDKDRDIISEYIIEILGLKYYKESILYADENNTNLYIYIIQIILIVLGIIFIINRLKGLNKLYMDKNFTFKNFLDCILYKIKDCENVLYKNHEIKVLYNIIFVPLCIILVIYIVINSTVNFNSNLNENIIIKPLIIYKRELKDINDSFKNLINNDKLDYTYLKSVNKNIANSILLVLYNDMFSDFLSLDDDKVNGLKWNRISNTEEINDSEELINEELSIELGRDKKEFTQDEWNEFNISELHSDNYIKVGNSYYKPEKNIDNNIKYVNGINITPEFHYTFNNEEDIVIDYNNLNEYNIEYYLNNKYNNNDIFKLNEYSKAVNKQCDTINKYLVYYIIRKIFLYNPIANELKDNNYNHIDETDRYRYYKNILKYKILKAIENIKKEKNYLGINKLDKKNNHKINNIISIRNKDPKLNREDIIKLLNTDHYNDMNKINKINKIKEDLIKANIYLDKSDINKILNFISSDESYNNIINNNKLSIILENKINKLEEKLNLNKLLEKIDKIIEDYIRFIINTQTSFYLNYNDCENKDSCNYNINIIELKNKIINNDNEANLVRFINTYKNNIKHTFKEINIKLTEFNDDNVTEDGTKYKNEKKSKLSNYIIDNYNLLNKENNYLNNEIVSLNNSICAIDNTNNNTSIIKKSNEDIYEKMYIIINDILLSFYFNNYLILKVYKSYNELQLDALVTNIQLLYKREDNIDNNYNFKVEYILILNKLKLILDKIINNSQTNELTIYDDDSLIDSSFNNNLIENMIQFDKNNKENEYYLNNVINIIKTFKKNHTVDIEISKENIKDIMGLENKIIVFIKFLDNNIIEEKFIDKTKKLINNLLILQNEILNKLNSSELSRFNYNKELYTLNYEYKFNNYISEYKEYYNTIYIIKNNENENENEDNMNERTFNINMNNSKITKRDAEKTSITITILLLIYILSYVSIASIK